MARIKYFTPFGERWTHTNDAESLRNVLTVWQHRERFDPKGWYTEAALEKGFAEVVTLNEYENFASLGYENGVFVVGGLAERKSYHQTFNSIRPARDYFVHVVHKMYPDN